CKEVAAKNITDITDPTPAPPRKGRVQEGMAAHKSFLQRVNCYIIAQNYCSNRLAVRTTFCNFATKL
ncbi:MAG: hypothetical protein K6B13_12580, partial [Prevotella sp.]|nr:hypothetical protein [Prevotella sp.]